MGIEKTPENIPLDETTHSGINGIESKEQEKNTTHKQLCAVSGELFPRLTKENTEAIVNHALETIHRSAVILTDEVIDVCEKHWSAMQQGEGFEGEESIPNDIFFSYVSLRDEGFSEFEIRELMNASQSGTLEKEMLAHVQNEKKEGDEWISKSVERIHEMESGIKTYFEEGGVPYPTKEAVPVVSIGKYQGMLINNAEDDTLGAFGAGGRYFAETGAIYIKHKPTETTEQGGLNDANMHLLAHERLHSLSTTNIPKIVNRIFNAEHTPHFQAGFAKVLENDNTLSYGPINEAATEYFTRKISEKIRYTERPAGAYDEEVASMELLLNYLGDSKKTTSELLAYYTSADGFTALKNLLEEKIGSDGLALCNALFTRPTLLEQFLRHCGSVDEGLTDKILELDIDAFLNASPSLDPSVIENNYPFIRLMTYVRDPKTREYKRVSYTQ